MLREKTPIPKNIAKNEIHHNENCMSLRSDKMNYLLKAKQVLSGKIQLSKILPIVMNLDNEVSY